MIGAVYAVVPAAGAGRRMAAAVPKQYLELAGHTVLEHTLWRLAGHPLIQKIVVAISAGDEYFEDLRARLPAKVSTAPGGAERCHSVLSALHALAAQARPDDCMEIHEDALQPGERVLIVDDLLATGGTCEAGIKLVERLGASVVGCAFVVDLPELGGRKLLERLGMQVHVLCEFEGA